MKKNIGHNVRAVVGRRRNIKHFIAGIARIRYLTIFWLKFQQFIKRLTPSNEKLELMDEEIKMFYYLKPLNLNIQQDQYQ